MCVYSIVTRGLEALEHDGFNKHTHARTHTYIHAQMVDMDNEKLPQSNRVAIVLVGLFKPKVTDLVALP